MNARCGPGHPPDRLRRRHRERESFFAGVKSSCIFLPLFIVFSAATATAVASASASPAGPAAAMRPRPPPLPPPFEPLESCLLLLGRRYRPG